MEKRNKYPFGIAYDYPFGGVSIRPEWLPKGPDDWKRDLKEIGKTGFNIIRMGIGFDSDLDDVEKLLDIALEEQLKVIFAFYTFYVNDDFVLKYPDSSFINADGSKIPEGIHDWRWQRACINHPVYLRMRNEMVEDCVKRFKGHNAVHIWDIHNEPGVGMWRPCYCPNSIKEFRKWLTKIYGDIASLNKDWGTRFEDFASVEPPRKPDELHRRQWDTLIEFIVANLTDFLQSGIDIIKKYDPDRPVTFNYFTEPITYAFPTDWWYGRKLDMVATSLYPSGGEHRGQTARHWHDLDLLRSITGKSPWIWEWQAGPINGDPFYSGDDIRVETFNALGHGVKGLIFCQWLPNMNRIEPWIIGLVEPGNYETERRRKVRDMIKEMRTVENVLVDGTPPKADIAIYVPRTAMATYMPLTPMVTYMTQTAEATSRDINQTINSSIGYHAVLNDLGYEVEFITDHFKRDDAHKLVIVPAIISLKQSEIQEINGYLEKGGKVLFEPTLNNIETCAAELDWLGLTPAEIEAPIYYLVVGWELRNSKNEFVSWGFHKRALLKEHAEGIVGYRFYDDQPAILTINRVGNLIVTMFPLGWTYLTGRLKGLRGIFKQWLADIEPAVNINVPEDVRPLIKAKVLKTKEQALLLVTSKATSKVNITLKVRGYRAVRTVLQPFTAKKYLLREAK